MSASSATTITTRAQAISKLAQAIAANAIQDDRRLKSMVRTATKRGEFGDEFFLKGVALGAFAAAQAWIKAEKLSAMAFGFTGQTDPKLRHGSDVTLKSPRRRR